MLRIDHYIISLLVFIFSIIPIYGFASEIDSLTDRCNELPDLTSHLNIIVTDGLDHVAQRANRRAKRRYMQRNWPFRMKEGKDYCNPDDLYRFIRKLYARVLVGQLESYIDDMPDTVVRKTPFEQSIYRDLEFRETPTLAGTKRLGGVIRIGNYIIGADKFGHFFAEGWTCFQYAVLFRNKSIDSALDYSRFSESLYYGASTTGVYSNADIAVNFNGLRFYSAITGYGVDPLGPEKRPKPYLACVQKKWKLIRHFDWMEYIDATWDEGLNPNYYRNETIYNKVTARMDEAVAALPVDCDCPLEISAEMTDLQGKYGRFSDIFINNTGPSVRPDPLRPTIFLKRLLKRPFQKPDSNQ